MVMLAERIVADAPGQVTALLAEARLGDDRAARALFPLVYEQLRRLAARSMRRERPDHTLQPTALVHEAFVRLVGSNGVEFADRAHFFLVAAQSMRHILVEHARRRAADKRGAALERVPLELAADASIEQRGACLLALDEALHRLTQIDLQAGRVVELRFFAGLSVEETAEALGVSPRTVKRDWNMAKGWLHRELQQDGR